jgi:formyltetrahydrofolate hydrolase
MRKAVTSFVVLAALVAVLSLKTVAEAKTMTWTGWISDSSCGVKGANAAHKACAETCMKTKGATWVFVNAEKKVIPIHNQDAVSMDTDLGVEVSVTGHLMDDGSVHVDKITPKS